jgi:co-chaperonin GroES (HSP10)
MTMTTTIDTDTMNTALDDDHRPRNRAGRVLDEQELEIMRQVSSKPITNRTDWLPEDFKALAKYLVLERKKIENAAGLEVVNNEKKPVRESISRVLHVGKQVEIDVQVGDHVLYANGIALEGELGPAFRNIVIVHELNILARFRRDGEPKNEVDNVSLVTTTLGVTDPVPRDGLSLDDPAAHPHRPREEKT